MLRQRKITELMSSIIHKPDFSWETAGWDHFFWQLIRMYTSHLGKNQRANFLQELQTADSKVRSDIDIADRVAAEVEIYCKLRETTLLDEKLALLRTEEESKQACRDLGIKWKVTKTKNKTHHQSSQSLVAIVSGIAKRVCDELNVTVNTDPRRRCQWSNNGKLHVTARNLDGAVPELCNPNIVWEIKEYWGISAGGSKMSDAVYECELVGKELREFERKSGARVCHVVFLDGKEQWHARESDLKRFIDLENRGLIDHLIVGKHVETKWEEILRSHI